MKCHITFTYDYSTDYVYFLDTKVKFKEQKLMTEIYSKPTASFQYLHRTSYHPPHTFRSILRSQFIRIRRICSDINDYWSHSKRFTNFFKSRGFNRMIIDKISTDKTFSTIIDPTFQSTNYYKQKGPAASHSLPHGTKNYLDFSQPFTIAIKK